MTILTVLKKKLQNIFVLVVYLKQRHAIFLQCVKNKDEFNGVVPDNMEDLLSLPGVGRKTANLILGDVYGKPAVVTDTHFIRICGKLGLTDNKAP